MAISLSAIASGLILNDPSASWAEIRATLSASNSPEAPPESSVDAVLDIEVATDTPDAFAKIVKADYQRWGEVIRSTGFTLDD